MCSIFGYRAGKLLHRVIQLNYTHKVCAACEGKKNQYPVIHAASPRDHLLKRNPLPCTLHFWTGFCRHLLTLPQNKCLPLVCTLRTFMAKVNIASLLSYELSYTLWNVTAQFKSCHEATKYKTIQKDGERKKQVSRWCCGCEQSCFQLF